MRWAPLALDSARLVMDIAWISVGGAIFASLVGANGGLAPLWLATGVAFLGFAMTRTLIPDNVPLGIARGWMLGVGAVVIYVAVTLLPAVGLNLAWPLHLSEDWLAARHAVVGGVIIGIFWWRGTHLGQEEVWARALAQSFRIGVGVVVVGAIVQVILPISLGVSPAAFLFFGAGIGAFALSHITTMAPEESAGLRDWPRTMALTVGGIMLGSILLAAAAEGDLGRIVASFSGFILHLLTPVAIVIGWVLELVIRVLTFIFLSLASFFGSDGRPPVEFTGPATPNFSGVARPEEGANGLLFLFLRLASWGLLVLTIAGVVTLLWRAFGFRIRRREQADNEERERLESEGTLGDDLAAALGSLMGGLGRRRKWPSVMDGLDRGDPRAVALGAYRGLLALAGEHGVERASWRTPREFDGDLHDLFPENDVGLFTDVFVRARYGDIAPSNSEVARLRATWTMLQSIPKPEQPKLSWQERRVPKVFKGPLPKGAVVVPRDGEEEDRSVPSGPDETRLM